MFCIFLQRWIVDILGNRFNRIYSDSSINAIKPLCGHIDFFIIAYKTNSINAFFLQKLTVWVIANAFKIIRLWLLYKLFVSSFHFVKQQNTCKNLISRLNSLILELSRKDESNRNFIQKRWDLLIFWTTIMEAEFLFRLLLLLQTYPPASEKQSGDSYSQFLVGSHIKFLLCKLHPTHTFTHHVPASVSFKIIIHFHGLQGTCVHHSNNCSQNQGISWVGRDPRGSLSPTPCPAQHHSQDVGSAMSYHLCMPLLHLEALFSTVRTKSCL